MVPEQEGQRGQPPLQNSHQGYPKIGKKEAHTGESTMLFAEFEEHLQISDKRHLDSEKQMYENFRLLFLTWIGFHGTSSGILR